MNYKALDLAINYINEEDQAQIGGVKGEKLGFKDALKVLANDKKAENKQKQEAEKEKRETYQKIDDYRNQLDEE